MKMIKALFLLFLVLLFLLAAIPTSNTGADDYRGPAPTPNDDGAAVLGMHVAYFDWQRVDPNGSLSEGMRFSMQRNQLYGMN